MSISRRILQVAPVLFIAGCVGISPVPAPPNNSTDLQRVYAAAEANMRDLGKMRTEYSPRTLHLLMEI